MENQISILDLFGRTLVSSGQHQPCQVNEEQFTVYLFSYQVGGIRTGTSAMRKVLPSENNKTIHYVRSNLTLSRSMTAAGSQYQSKSKPYS